MACSSPSLDLLPDALLERILALLPFTNVFRIAIVCKRWNSIVSTKEFVHLCEQRTSSRPWFFLHKPFGPYEGFAYDPLDERWLNCSELSGLEKACGWPVASANGLICFKSNSNALILCNPMTKFLKKLAEPSTNRSGYTYSVSMAANKDSASPTIILAQFDFLESSPDYLVSIKEYDFSVENWGTKAATQIHRSWNNEPPSVMCKGFFYCFVMSNDHSRQALITYELSSGVLNVASVRPALWYGTLVSVRLMNWNDKIVFVGRYITTNIGIWERVDTMLDTEWEHITTDIGIWELVDTEWRQIARMPDVHSKTLADSCYSSGLGDFIYILSYRPRHLFRYSLSERSWVRTERCPMVQERPSHSDGGFYDGRFYAGICFEPRLKVYA